VDGFETLCAILRVGGMEDANWDPFEESRSAFEDYNWMLERVRLERGDTAARRVRLLMYCQAVEMSAPQEIIANLLRCLNKKSHAVDPFAELWRPRKGKVFGIPPSAPMKYNLIRTLAADTGRSDLTAAIECFFDERVRNAFSHSDYIITDDEFRFSDGGLAQSIPLAQLDRLTEECFTFFGSFISVHRLWLRHLGKGKRFHQMPQYEVLELLRSEEDGLYGFQMHFSNGSRATYARRRAGIEATNLVFERDGGINFQVGLIDKLEAVWKIDGQPVEDWKSLP
jgi:hypothetical protein